jgi:hypothetical protein
MFREVVLYFCFDIHGPTASRSLVDGKWALWRALSSVADRVPALRVEPSSIRRSFMRVIEYSILVAAPGPLLR